MSDPVSSIRNIGPATQAAFHRAGIHSADQLRALGADAGYLALLMTGTPAHFIGYYILVMGLQGRPWNDAQGAEKAALRLRFDTLKADAQRRLQAQTPRRPDFEAALDVLGVIERR